MNRKKYFLWLGSAISLLLITYYSLLYFQYLFFPTKLSAIVGFGIIFEFVIGSFIITHQKVQEGSSFVMGFLVLTTFQIITILALLIAVKFTQAALMKDFIIHFFSLFFPLFIVQSVLLVKWVKRGE